MAESNLPDMNDLFAHAQEMQRRLAETQQQLAATEVSGSSGGGLVTARVTGAGELVALSIDPRVLTSAGPPETAEAIADLVVAAVRHANESAERLRERAMAPLANELGLGDGGHPGLSGLPGL